MKRLVIIVMPSLALIGLGAAGGAAAAPTKLHVLTKACVASKSRAVTAPVSGRCPKGTLLEQLGTSTPGRTGSTGASGAAGGTGPQGPQGPQGPAGAPATAKSFMINWKQGGTAPLTASTGVSLTSGPIELASTHEEETLWHFPLKLSSCALEVTVATQSGILYSVEGGSTTPTGPIAQATVKAGDPTSVWVDTEWPGGTGTDFSLLVTCP